MYADSGV
ncbi:hypothetical protein EYF80_067090 [Liparis tanakae]|nr:hypothetical protein EYF80_067090 [Liparis tanakae]